MTHIHSQVLSEQTRIGVYEVKDVLKISSFTISYMAWNHHLNEQVVLHEYFPVDFVTRGEDGFSVTPNHPDNKKTFEYGLDVFLKQAEILAQIDHPNIVTTENVLQFNDTVYLVESAVKGHLLSDLMHSSVILTEAKVKHILVSTLDALETVHGYKLVHGGIHPGTITLDKQEKPVLTEFAVARLAWALRVGKMDSELNPGYTPMEQYQPMPESGPATDFYALGATMYHMMTGKQPISIQQRMHAISKNEPDPISQDLETSSLQAEYSSVLLDVVNWMLHPDYQARPQTATEIKARLASDIRIDQLEPVVHKQNSTGIAAANNGRTVENQSWRNLVIASIIGIVGSGLWFSEKNTDNLNESAAVEAFSTLSQQHTQQITVQSTQEDSSNTVDVGTEEVVNQEKVAGDFDKEVFEFDQQENKVAKIPEPKTSPLDDELELKVPDESIGVIIRTPNKPEKSLETHLINEHLSAAKKAMAEFRFVTPEGNNAFEHYKAVLVVDPGHAEAHAGMREIVDGYIHLINKAINKGELNNARVFLRRAETIIPDDTRLRAKHQVLKEIEFEN